MYEDNNESKIETSGSSEKIENSSMSLDDRKEQLENKINREMSTDEKPPLKSDVSDKSENGMADNEPQTEVKSPYDRATTTRLNHYNSPSVRMPLPKRNDNPQTVGSSYDVYKNSGYPQYPNGGINEQKPYSLYGRQTPKEKMSGALKSYLIIISSITVIFLVGFILECVNTYNNNGIFGGANGIFSGDFDKYLDTDYDFGFKFGKDDSDEAKKDEDTDKSADSDSLFDSINKTDSDSDGATPKAAPDASTVVNKSAATIKAENQPEDIDSAEYTARKAFKRVENSVVNVVVYNGEVGNEDDAASTGSGIIISEDGYIVTNSHVINDSKKYGVEIITTAGDSYIATVVGYDSRTDLAVLKINDFGLTAAEFVNSDQIEVGQDAIAVGNPGGMAYSNSLTRGCVSALNRTVSTNKMVTYIQTDAAINPGNSGGPLLNSAGQVMGITTVKIANSDYEGMGFAIPSNTVISIVNDLIGQGYVSGRVRIGITGTAVSEDYTKGTPGGIAITSFSEDSPFEGTEAELGDIIMALNGKTIKTFPELFAELNNYNPGDKATITLYRAGTGITSGQSFDVEIELMADNGETQR